MIVPCAKLHAAYNAIARRSRALPARPGAMAKPAGALNRMAAGNRIAELIGRYGLLHEGRKIGNPAGDTQIQHESPVLPDVVAVVACTVDIPAAGTLIHMHVMDAVAIGIKAPENVDVILVIEGFGKKGVELSGRFLSGAAVEHIALQPAAGAIENSAAQKVEGGQGAGTGQAGFACRRCAQSFYDGVMEVLDDLVFEQVRRIICPHIGGDIPVRAAYIQGEVKVILYFFQLIVMHRLRLKPWQGCHLRLNETVC